MSGDAIQPSRDRAVDEWIDVFREMLVEGALRQGMSPDDAQDCAQESIVHMLTETLELSFRGPASKFHAWLRSIARHDVLDFARHLARERHDMVSLSANVDAADCPQEIEVADTRLTPEEALAKTLFWELLAPAIDALDDEEHFCFIRFHLLGQDAKSIAKAEGSTEKHVYRVLEKARRHAARSLAQHGTTEEELIALLPIVGRVPPSGSAVDEWPTKSAKTVGVTAENAP
jgi:RNA polymerase sigma factor (sigma-70 family)